MSALSRVGRWLWPAVEPERAAVAPQISLDDWAQMFQTFQFQGLNYTLSGSPQETIGSGFSQSARLAYKSNGVVFAVMLVRQLLFSEARFAFQRMRGGRPGDLFSFRDADLAVLERPWAGGTTGDLLTRMIQHADLAGNAFVARRGSRLMVLRPDWVSIVIGSASESAEVWDVDAEVIGYSYQEGGPGSGRDPVLFAADEVAHFAPIPDPEARFRGMSWLTPIVREVMADKAMSDHRLAFFENAGTPNLAIKLDVQNLETFKNWVAEFKQNHDGASNAYKTMFLAAGADATVIGTDLKQLDFKVVQGAGETRIAAAGGVPPVIVGLSEGLEAATYSNYGMARRRFADGTMRPLWRQAAAALSNVVAVPSDARLWYDDRDISFLQEDQQDAAGIFQVEAQSYRTLVDGGVSPESAAAAVAARDITLVQHTGLLSVQLQEPGSQGPPDPAEGVPAQDGANADREVWQDIIARLQGNRASTDNAPEGART